MHFKLVYGNHWNFGLQVGDTFRYLKLALESAGHRADIEKQICPGYINVLQECFDDAFTIQVLEARSSGVEFIVIATEFLTQGTFNEFQGSTLVQQESSYYADRSYWDKRFNNFSKIAKVSKAIWHLCEQEVMNYQDEFTTIPVAYLPHAFVDGYETVTHLPDDQKDIDFLFTGTLTDYRKGLLGQLSDKGYSVSCMHALTAPFHRDDLISRSKIALNLKQYDAWLYPSPSRFFYHVVNNSCLVSQKGEFVCDIQAYVDTCETDQFIEYCEYILNLNKFAERAQQRQRRFANEMPAKPLITALLLTV